jgi:hypothetical protein
MKSGLNRRTLHNERGRESHPGPNATAAAVILGLPDDNLVLVKSDVVTAGLSSTSFVEHNSKFNRIGKLDGNVGVN